MKRRDFIKRLSWASVPFTIGGIPLKLMAENPLTRMAQQSNNDRVLVILQMHGGNDGLNCLIPVEAYDEYYSRRANIAIPAKNSLRKMIPVDSTVPSDAQIGLHPDMMGMKELYDQGRMSFVQGVSYKNNNGSHFRGRDISFMGGSFDDYFSSGWVGRFLQQEFAPKTYPDEFPNEEMKDPLAIEMGSDVSLIFHQQGNIPTSISLSNPVSFFNLVNELEGFVDQGIDPRGKPPTFLDNSPYGKELNWILGLEEKSEDYAERLFTVYNNSPEATVTYPERYPFNAPSGSITNRLTPQLKLIARLLDGGGAGLGVKTKVFLVKVGGFDTHAEQVESYDPTMGSHAALMYNISSAMKAFQEDLRARGIEDRVLTVTTSEFGRRIHSNGSYGTDHGTGGPMFLFGKGVKPGIVGKVPDLTKNNVEMQFDYRQVYANILKDWMLVDEDTINNEIFFKNFINGPKEEGAGNYEPLDVASQVISATNSDFIKARFALTGSYPNPANGSTTIEFRINTTSQVHLQLFDSQGRALKVLLDTTLDAGEHSVNVDLQEFKPGMYLYKLKSGFLKDTKKLVISR
ncbi:MAG TPA: DUF1501 domain-containing protein [Cyclobacteriaceae bacterium]|nr:DUF1501 domain-containing protein [Cyclobacteriaceae bacterium]HRK54225.1 DUF1501 domain-containing protein [Cyclobacteriaceae bacterium]